MGRQLELELRSAAFCSLLGLRWALHADQTSCSPAQRISRVGSSCQLHRWRTPVAEWANGRALTLHSPLALAPSMQAGHSAAALVRHIRSACCWGGAAEPRRLLVIINPASGPGRRVVY